MFTEENIREASQRAQKRLQDEPHIVRAHFDSKLERVILSLNSGAWFAFCPADAQGLEGATTAQLREIEILPGSFAINFPQLDVQFSLQGLLAGHFGTRAWMAQRLGAAGGSSRSEAKRAASQRNGKLGGRPRKAVVAG